MVSQRKRAEAKVGKGEVSVKQLKGMFYDPKRKPASIEEMNEAVMQAVVEADIRTRMQNNQTVVSDGSAEPFLHHPQLRSPPVIRQTLHKHAPILLFQDAIIQQYQEPAIIQ